MIKCLYAESSRHDSCIETLDRALGTGTPEIFNTDQGSQFTSVRFTDELEADGIEISMDGQGRVADNIFLERLWPSVKDEEVYLKEYATVREARSGIGTTSDFTISSVRTSLLGTRPRIGSTPVLVPQP